jgi:hypothetical protein
VRSRADLVEWVVEGRRTVETPSGEGKRAGAPGLDSCTMWAVGVPPFPAREVPIQPQPGADAQADDRAPGQPRFDPWAGGLLAIALGLGALTFDRGWIPHDDGMLAQAAIRVLTGELPHRDFQEMYTGGLSYWHALSFALFGIHLLAPRVLLLLSFAGFLAVAYALARRFAGPRPSAAAVLLGAVWSVPNYPAAMPTWYNLFLAALAVWCVFRYLDTRARRWLIAAGAACGVSIVIKIVGLYTLAAILIGLVLVDAEAERDASHASSDDAAGTSGAYTAAVVAGLLAFLALVVGLIRSRLDLENVVHFLVPSVAVASVVAWKVSRTSSAVPTTIRVARFAKLKGSVLAGAAIPVALFLAPYVLSGSIGSLVEGLFVLPLSRSSLAATSASPLPLASFAPALAPLALAALAAVGPTRVRKVALGVMILLLASVLVLGGNDAVFRSVWGGLLLTPVLVTVGALGVSVAAWKRNDRSGRALPTALLAISLGTFTLVQYPYSGPIYFFYIAPLVAPVALAGFSLAPSAWRPPGTALLVFTLLFGARWIATAELFATAQGRYAPRPAVERLAIERGRIRIPVAEGTEYGQLAGALQELSSGTGVTFVTPDAPEAYFLSGLRNPTTFFYDFLDEPEGRTQRILRTIEDADVRVIALNRAPSLSGAPPADLIAALEARYPMAANVGRFVVRWR